MSKIYCGAGGHEAFKPMKMRKNTKEDVNIHLYRMCIYICTGKHHRRKITSKIKILFLRYMIAASREHQQLINYGYISDLRVKLECHDSGILLVRTSTTLTRCYRSVSISWARNIVPTTTNRFTSGKDRRSRWIGILSTYLPRDRLRSFPQQWDNSAHEVWVQFTNISHVVLCHKLHYLWIWSPENGNVIHTYMTIDYHYKCKQKS